MWINVDGNDVLTFVLIAFVGISAAFALWAVRKTSSFLLRICAIGRTHNG